MTQSPQPSPSPPSTASTLSTASTSNGAGLRFRSLVGRYGFLVPIALYVAQRLWFVFSGRVVLDSDEAIYGIMALDALHGRLTPFFYGQDYMGAFQALVSIPMILLLGATPLALRVTMILEGVAVLLLWRWILGRWGMKAVWGWAALLLAFAPAFVTFLSIKSRGSIEALTVGAIWLALFTALVRSDDASPLARRGGRWFLLGLATGIGWWTCQQVVYFIAPAVVYLVIDGSFRRRLSPVWIDAAGEPSPRASILSGSALPWILSIVYAASLLLLTLRGTAGHESRLSAWIYQWRWMLGTFHIAAAAACYAAVLRRRAAVWPLAFGIGSLLGYAPALSVLLAKPHLYNGAILPPLRDIPANISSFFILSGGSTIGLLGPKLSPVGLPLAAILATVAVYGAAVCLLLLSTLRRRRPSTERRNGETLLALSFGIGYLLFLLTQRFEYGWPRYAFFMIFYLMLTVAWFLDETWRFNRPLAIALTALLIGVNLHSVIRHPALPVAIPSLSEPMRREMIEFLVARDVHVGIVGPGDAATGYWFAYCLSFESEQRLVVHPAAHMPRIDRYAALLRESERIAIITRHPDFVEDTFRKEGLPSARKDFGEFSVFYDFDKKSARAVRELGLADY